MRARAAIEIIIMIPMTNVFMPTIVTMIASSSMKWGFATRPSKPLARRGKIIVLLLCGGTKKTQRADIERAIEIAKEMEG